MVETFETKPAEDYMHLWATGALQDVGPIRPLFSAAFAEEEPIAPGTNYVRNLCVRFMKRSTSSQLQDLVSWIDEDLKGQIHVGSVCSGQTRQFGYGWSCLQLCGTT